MVIPCRIDFGKNGVYDAMLIGKTVYLYNGYWWYINKGRVDFSRPGNVVFFH